MSGRARLRNVALLLLLTFLWGSSFMFVKLAVETLPPLTLSAGRLALGAAALGTLLVGRQEGLPREARIWMIYGLLGLIEFAIPFFLIGWGTARIDSGLTAILIGTAPIFTILLAHPINRDEPLTAAKLVAVALGFAGIVMLVGEQTLAGLGREMWGQLAIIGAAVGYALGLIIARRLSHLSAVTNGTGVSLAAFLWLLPFALALDRPWTLDPSALSLVAVGVLGLAPTALASIVLFRLLAATSAGFVGLGNYLVPLVGVFLGALVLSETVEWNEIGALALVLLGIAVASRRPAAAARRAES